MPLVRQTDPGPALRLSADGLRSPETVMRLARMGSSFPTRLSFMRTLLRHLSAMRCAVTRPVWEIDRSGHGRAVYSISIGGRVCSLVVFSRRLDPDQRTDRVIATVWDTTYALYDGFPDEGELKRLEANVPLQEAGRYLPSELVISRANKSIRLFEHVVSCLAAGRQPDADMTGSVGYLMRTTAVYGNGKFGIADRERLCRHAEFSDPFQAELLAVWLIRGFTHDLAEHVARHRSPDTWVPLERRIRRHLGIGNSTGLGMAPFLVNHPTLLHQWIRMRETALARVRSVKRINPDVAQRLRRLAERACRHLLEWNVEDHLQMERILQLRDEWDGILRLLEGDLLMLPYPVDCLLQAASKRSLECQELAVALALEPFGDLVDVCAGQMSCEANPEIDPSMSVGRLRKIIFRHYGWALKIDFSSRGETDRFWYVSEDKFEPRLGKRYDEPGAEQELPLDIARRVQALECDLEDAREDMMVAEFLLVAPQHRYVVRRIQTVERHPYGEIRDNLIGSACLPVDMLRCKLSFFGASKFDPKSDRWTRITLFQGAPLFDEIASGNADDWWLPAQESADEVFT